MSLYNYTKSPSYPSNTSQPVDYIATSAGWVNAKTGEVVVAIGNLNTRENVGHTSILESVVLATPATTDYVTGGNFSLVATYSQDITITGTPEIGITIGGVAKNATYASGSGTNQLTFTYTVASGDTGAIVVVSPIVLNSGTIKDSISGNASPLTFTAPTTTNVKAN